MNTIFLVDSDKNMLHILQIIFERAKYRVLICDDSTKAVDLIYQRQPDVVLIEDMMPAVSGSEVCQTLKQMPSTRHIPVIIHCAGTDAPDIELMYEMGASAALSKPAHPALLLETVNQCLTAQTG